MIHLISETLDPGAELTRFCAARADVGAVASFVGLARGARHGQSVLELEAYEGFTDAVIEGFVAQARQRFGLLDVAVFHRIGAIAVGEPIVIVLTAAPHRREAFEACDFLMDVLKSRAPFWKKEIGPEGARWIEPTSRDLSDLSRWA